MTRMWHACAARAGSAGRLRLIMDPNLIILAFSAVVIAAYAFDNLCRKVKQDLAHFKQIVIEGAFFVRTFFFLLLGFSTDLADFTSSTAWIVTGVIVALIYATRWPLLRVLCPVDVFPLVWIAPRGLITVVLFLSLPGSLKIAHFPEGTVMLVVPVTAVLLGGGIRASAPALAVAAETPEGAQGTTEP